jgi:hypothetical protein
LIIANLGAPVKWNDHKPTLSRLNMLQFLFVFMLQSYIERAAEVGDIKRNNCTSCRLENKNIAFINLKKLFIKFDSWMEFAAHGKFCVMEDILLTIKGDRLGSCFKGTDTSDFGLMASCIRVCGY